MQRPDLPWLGKDDQGEFERNHTLAPLEAGTVPYSAVPPGLEQHNGRCRCRASGM